MASHVARAPVQSRAHRTRAALLEAAERDFDERGYAQTTTKSIADRAGVAAGSFYQYFADKDAALRELAFARMQGLRTRIETAIAPSTRVEMTAALTEVERAYRKAVRVMVHEAIEYHRKDTGLHAVLSERRHVDPALDAMTAESERSSVASIEKVLASFGYAGDRKAVAFVIFGMIEGSVHSHVLGTRVVSDRRFIEALSGAVVELVRSGVQGAISSSDTTATE
jgi:AcrR family transcriptional regulator